MVFIVGAQLQTSNSATQRATLDDVLGGIARITARVELSILIVGAKEVPTLFEALTNDRARPVSKVYLWYDLLSDVRGATPDDLVVNWRGERSRGWGGWSEQDPNVADVEETFRFGCPNNPDGRRKTLRVLGELLDRYPFDGVFLDKIRFPSPANGADEMVSCFCSYCRRAAAAVGLDLDAVVDLVAGAKFASQIVKPPLPGRRLLWTDELIAPDSLLAQFLRFRCDSITSIVAEAAAEAQRRDRIVALDLFSPSLGPVVGQDYAALSRHASWVKPMTYRVAKGPASLRLEVPALVDNIATLGKIEATELEAWCSENLPGFGRDTVQATRGTAVPFTIVGNEIATAVRLARPAPIYFGLELVCYPGFVEITPADVHGMMEAGSRAEAAGAIISWDLMRSPDDALRALGKAL
jgi:hypothetical protein